MHCPIGSLSDENGCQMVYDAQTDMDMENQVDFCNEMGMTLLSATNLETYNTILSSILDIVVRYDDVKESFEAIVDYHWHFNRPQVFLPNGHAFIQPDFLNVSELMNFNENPYNVQKQQAVMKMNSNGNLQVNLFNPISTSTRFVVCHKQPYKFCVEDNDSSGFSTNANYISNCIQLCQDSNSTVSKDLNIGCNC